MKREVDFNINDRIKKYGNMGGVWICDHCNHEIQSFLYNWEYHVPENCPKCKEGILKEDENRRTKPIVPQFIDANRQKNWTQGLTPAQQAAVLSDEKVNPY